MAVVLYDDFNDAPAGQGVQHRPGWVNHPTSRFTTSERFVTTGDGLAYCNHQGTSSWGIVIGADTTNNDHYVEIEPDFAPSNNWVCIALRVTGIRDSINCIKLAFRNEMMVTQFWTNGVHNTSTIYYSTFGYAYSAGDKFRAVAEGNSLTITAITPAGIEVPLGVYDVSAVALNTFAGWTNLGSGINTYITSIEIGNLSGGGGDPQPTQTPNHGLLALF